MPLLPSRANGVHMLFKILVVTILVFILASLGFAMFSLIRDGGQSERTLKALTIRIGLSVALFILLLAGYAMGLITPHPV